MKAAPTKPFDSEEQGGASGERYRRLVESAMDAIVTIDQRQCIVQFNGAAEAMFGYPADDVIGKPLGMLLPDRYKGSHHGLVDRYGATGATSRRMGALTQLVGRRASGEEFPLEASISMLGAGQERFYAAIVRDISARNALEQHARRQADFFAALSRTNSALVRLRDPQSLFWEICRICVDHGHASMAYVGLVEGARVVPVAWAGPAEDYLAGIEISLDPTASTGIGPVAHCIRQAVPHVANDVENDPNMLPWHERARIIGSRATAAFPISRSAAVIGALSLHVREKDFFTPELIELIGELVSDISFALDSIDRETARAQAVAAAQAGFERFQAIFHTTPIATSIATIDESRLLDVNPAFCALVGYAREEVLGRTTLELGLRNDQEARPDYLKRLAKDRRLRNESLTIRVRSGAMRDVLISAELIEFQDRVCMLSTYEDVTERKRYELRIEYLATHDSLTRLPNRTLARDRIDQAIRQARRAENMFGVLFLDLDRFKLINDGLGHRAGDEVLALVAQRLREVTREGDTVARVGGDEFVIVLPDLRTASDAAVVAQKIVDVFQLPLAVAGQNVYVAASIGVAMYPDDGTDVDTLVRNADVAMYHGKRAGRGAFQRYHTEMIGGRAKQVEFETELRLALSRNQLSIVYQPKVEMATGRISGVEALLRWTHPTLGAVAPTTFIPVAEESGLIVAIGEWVLETACRDARQWQLSGLPQIRLAINLSPRQFLQRNLVEMVKATLERTDLSPQFVEFELTETLIGQDIETVTRTMRILNGFGVRFAIDDFGVGYSSLSHLKRFPVDRLKIDQSFVRDLETDAGDAGIALAVISLARALKLKVTAEGVETPAQYRFMREHQCDEIQGNLLSPPVSAAEIAAMLASGLPGSGLQLTAV